MIIQPKEAVEERENEEDKEETKEDEDIGDHDKDEEEEAEHQERARAPSEPSPLQDLPGPWRGGAGPSARWSRRGRGPRSWAT